MGRGNMQIGKEFDSASVRIAGWRGGSFRNRRFHAIHRRDESVSATSKSLDETRIGRGIAQRLANLVYSSIQAVIEIDERIGRPDLLPQVITRNHTPGIFQQHAENLKRLLLQTHSSAILAELSSGEVHLKDAKPQKPGFAAGR